MNDTTETGAAKTCSKSPRKYVWIAAGIILAVGVAGYVASKLGLDRALVKEAVDNFAANLQASSHDTLSFTYQDIKIAGGLTDRHAVIIGPKLEQSPEGLESAQKITYTTEEAVLYPTSSDLSALKIELAKPIKGYKGSDVEGEAAMTAIPRIPFVIDATQKRIKGNSFIESRISIPDSLLIDGPQSERGKPWNQFTVSLKPGAYVVNLHSPEADAPEGLGKTEIVLDDVKLTPEHDAEAAITIAKVHTHYENMQADDGGSQVTVTADVGPVTGSEKTLPYGPIELALSLSYDGLLSSAPQDFANQQEEGEKSLKLKTFSLKAKDSALYATADFVSGAKDVLPVGTANVTIENVPFILQELRAQHALDQKNEVILAAITQQVTGKPLGEAKDVSVDIKRVRDGAFQIGNTTFEELAAVVFRAALSGQAPIALPSTEAPAAEEEQMPVESAPEEAAEPEVKEAQ